MSIVQSTNGVPIKSNGRVRIAMPPSARGAKIFYRDEENIMLQPLADTDGLIFPFQPTISISHHANYQTSSLTHSNFNFFNYQNSSIEPIQLSGEFIVRSADEARYVLAGIQFLRALTKMFNTNDADYGVSSGTPPLVARLYGLGYAGFDVIPVILTNVTVAYPDSVDFITFQIPALDNEVSKLPVSLTITVDMQPIFSRKFATDTFGANAFSSGAVRLLGPNFSSDTGSGTEAVGETDMTPNAAALEDLMQPNTGIGLDDVAVNKFDRNAVEQTAQYNTMLQRGVTLQAERDTAYKSYLSTKTNIEGQIAQINSQILDINSNGLTVPVGQTASMNQSIVKLNANLAAAKQNYTVSEDAYNQYIATLPTDQSGSIINDINKATTGGI